MASHLDPSREGPGTGTAMIRGVGIGGASKEICDLIMSCEKALGLSG
jgi:hypothetical protein